MNTPFISVIVPAYNVEKYIYPCLKSLKNQSYKNFETIIVDDCSTDGTLKIIQDFITENPQMNIQIYRHDKNRGISAARNTGIRSAVGVYLYFLDSDDDIYQNCLLTLADHAIKGKAYVIVAENYLISDDEKRTVSLEQTGTIINEQIIETYCSKKWYCQVWNKLCKRPFIIENNLYFEEGTILEDEIWSFKLACVAKKIEFVKEVTYNYYIRPKSIISNVRNSDIRWSIFLNVNRIIHNPMLKPPVIKNNACII